MSQHTVTDLVRGIDRRAVVLFVALDLATYALVFWLLVPSFDQFLTAIDPTTAVAIGWVLSVVRLTLISVITVRSSRDRRGLVARSDIVPTMLVAAGAAWFVQLVLGVSLALFVGVDPWSWRMLLDLVVWVVFALIGVLFVAPGAAERLPLRYRVASERERGSVSALLIPAVAGLVAVTIVVIVMVGSATNDRRESTTAADAAALAAADVWVNAVENAFDAAWDADDADGFWGFAGTDLGALSSGAVSAAAARYADDNDATLVSLNVDPVRAEVTVRVRNNDTVPNSDRRIESVATAKLVLESGACRSGRWLGFLVGGSCRTAPPAPTPTPTPTPEPSPTPGAPPPPPPPPPPPFAPPGGIGGFRADTELTVTR